MNRRELGELIRRDMQSSGLTLREYAKAVGTNKTLISDCKNGRGAPGSTEVREALAKRLNVDPNTLPRPHDFSEEGGNDPFKIYTFSVEELKMLASVGEILSCDLDTRVANELILFLRRKKQESEKQI